MVLRCSTSFGKVPVGCVATRTIDVDLPSNIFEQSGQEEKKSDISDAEVDIEVKWVDTHPSLSFEIPPIVDGKMKLVVSFAPAALVTVSGMLVISSSRGTLAKLLFDGRGVPLSSTKTSSKDTNKPEEKPRPYFVPVYSGVSLGLPMDGCATMPDEESATRVFLEKAAHHKDLVDGCRVLGRLRSGVAQPTKEQLREMMELRRQNTEEETKRVTSMLADKLLEAKNVYAEMPVGWSKTSGDFSNMRYNHKTLSFVASDGNEVTPIKPFPITLEEKKKAQTMNKSLVAKSFNMALLNARIHRRCQTIVKSMSQPPEPPMNVPILASPMSVFIDLDRFSEQNDDVVSKRTIEAYDDSQWLGFLKPALESQCFKLYLEKL